METEKTLGVSVRAWAEGLTLALTVSARAHVSPGETSTTQYLVVGIPENISDISPNGSTRPLVIQL